MKFEKHVATIRSYHMYRFFSSNGVIPALGEFLLYHPTWGTPSAIDKCRQADKH
jgi:hypothetical protein